MAPQLTCVSFLSKETHPRTGRRWGSSCTRWILSHIGWFNNRGSHGSLWQEDGVLQGRETQPQFNYNLLCLYAQRQGKVFRHITF
jgi:hypothetical protein